jgi:predicted DNA-binding helix-hairpin-helix protein
MSAELAQWVNKAVCCENIRSLDSEEASMFIKLCLVDGQDIIDDSIHANPMYQIMKRRLVHLNMNLTDSTQLMLLALCETPADIVMHIAILYQRFAEEKVTLSELTMLFPNGFLTRDALDLLWDDFKKITE